MSNIKSTILPLKLRSNGASLTHQTSTLIFLEINTLNFTQSGPAKAGYIFLKPGFYIRLINYSFKVTGWGMVNSTHPMEPGATSYSLKQITTWPSAFT